MVPKRNEADRVVHNGDQASGNSVNDAIIVFGSGEDDSLPDPGGNLDLAKIACLNRNCFVLDTRTFCPMCRSTRHGELGVDIRKPRTEYRHSTFNLWGYHLFRQDWHLNFTPAEKIIQLGHTILHCAGIRSQLVMEWHDCVHTRDIELTDEDALGMTFSRQEDHSVPPTSTFPSTNLLRTLASNENLSFAPTLAALEAEGPMAVNIKTRLSVYSNAFNQPERYGFNVFRLSLL